MREGLQRSQLQRVLEGSRSLDRARAEAKVVVTKKVGTKK